MCEPLVERVVAPTTVRLPVQEGQRLGRVEVYAGDHLLASSNLVAAASASEPGALGKVLWYVRATGDNLWELVT